MTDGAALAIIIAAGKGTRMKSALPKVLHKLAGAPMLTHVIGAASASGFGRMALVVAPEMDAVEAAAKTVHSDIEVHIQEEQLGTAHAVLAARSALEGFEGPVVVLFGDTPFLRPETLGRVRSTLGDGADLVVLGFEADDPTGYGRLLTGTNGELLAIREEKDASAEERAVRLCNSGVVGISGTIALGLLERIGCDNAKGEYYLTDAVALARADGLTARYITCAEDEVLGINSRAQLAEAEAILQDRLRRAAMDAGTTFVAPDTVYLSHDTVLGRDVTIEPHVIIGPGVTVEDGATIRGFSHIEAARIGEGATVGPFARLRPGTEVGPGARIGNFVEVKNATLEDGAKVNHLTYIGDARVGAAANVGAGTITCNYDGFDKHHTDIGEGAFIGSNSALVAPVKIGAGAYVGSGSVITKDVPGDALAVTRAPLDQREGWAEKVRARRGRKGQAGGATKRNSS